MKFSIRDLLLVTVIVALTVAWGADRWRLADELVQEREFRSNLEEIDIRYRQTGYKRMWGEPKGLPIGEY